MKFIIPTIVICTHNVDDFVLNSLEKIKSHSPESEIIVVDSNSPKKDYLNIAESTYGAKIIEGNSNYELGAWRLASNAYERDSYLFLQDSVLQKKPIPTELLQCPFLAFEALPQWTGAKRAHVEGTQSILAEAGIEISPDFHMICGSMMLIKNTLWKQLDECIPNFVPQNKEGSCNSERVLGIIMTHLGFNPGNHMLQRDSWHRNNGEYFTKIWKKRQ